MPDSTVVFGATFAPCSKEQQEWIEQWFGLFVSISAEVENDPELRKDWEDIKALSQSNSVSKLVRHVDIGVRPTEQCDVLCFSCSEDDEDTSASPADLAAIICVAMRKFGDVHRTFYLTYAMYSAAGYGPGGTLCVTAAGIRRLLSANG